MFSLPRLTEKGFTVLTLLLFTGALLPVLRPFAPNGNVIQGDPIVQALWIGIYALTFALIFIRWKHFIYVLTKNRLLVLLVGIALISVLWSAAPEITFRRSIALVGTTMFGFYFAIRYSLKQQLQLLGWALGIAALLSLVLALALPSYGISNSFPTAGDWKGVYGHKNSLGKSMTLGTTIFFILAASSRRYRWLLWFCCGLCFSILLLSNSITGLVIILVLTILWPLCRALRWHSTVAIPFAIVVLLIGAGATILLLSNTETVLNALGKDTTLTGRATLWPAVVEMIKQRPWLGYGYDGFWLGWEGYSAQVWLATGQEYAHAHNGVLAVWLELGLLGVLVFVLVFLRTFLRVVVWPRHMRTAEGYWPLMFLSFFALNSLVESTILSENNIFWVLYVTIVAMSATYYSRYDKLAYSTEPPTNHQL